jgi:hypothetical protein
VLPQIDVGTGLLPASAAPYAATLEEIHDRFVAGAPFEPRRQLLFDTLVIYSKLIWAIYPDARLRIDGGFVTHKTWAAPDDIDIAVVCPTISPLQRDTAISAGLFSIKGATGNVHRRTIEPIPKLHPMGGLIDSFYVPQIDNDMREFFEKFWATETGPDKLPTGRQKGYVEVVNPDGSV